MIGTKTAACLHGWSTITRQPEKPILQGNISVVLSDYCRPTTLSKSHPSSAQEVSQAYNSTNMSNRALYVAAPIAAGVGYYFYQAGGDPKAAQKRLEGKHLQSWTHRHL